MNFLILCNSIELVSSLYEVKMHGASFFFLIEVHYRSISCCLDFQKKGIAKKRLIISFEYVNDIL